MKRPFLLLAFLVLLSSGTAFGESHGFNYLAGLGASYLALNENYSIGTGAQNITLGGVGLESSFMTGLPLGVLGSVTIAYALNGALDGTPLVMSAYSSRLLFDMLFGIGYRMRLSRKISLLIGAGGSAAGALMLTTTYNSSLNLAYAGGFGAMMQADYALTHRMSLSVDASGAYNPFSIGNAVAVGFKNGFNYSVGAGLDFLY